MLPFLGDFARYSAFYLALLAVFALPAVLVARHYRHPGTARRFLIAAGVAGTFCGFERAMTERLESQCRAKGNTQCFDYGGSGLVVLILVVFLATSVVRAYLIHND